eukprot:765328-Hanusia_phi.AAC.6
MAEDPLPGDSDDGPAEAAHPAAAEEGEEVGELKLIPERLGQVVDLCEPMVELRTVLLELEELDDTELKLLGEVEPADKVQDLVDLLLVLVILGVDGGDQMSARFSASPFITSIHIRCNGWQVEFTSESRRRPHANWLCCAVQICLPHDDTILMVQFRTCSSLSDQQKRPSMLSSVVISGWLWRRKARLNIASWTRLHWSQRSIARHLTRLHKCAVYSPRGWKFTAYTEEIPLHWYRVFMRKIGQELIMFLVSKQIDLKSFSAHRLLQSALDLDEAEDKFRDEIFVIANERVRRDHG